jgi:regulator of sigma E protease
MLFNFYALLGFLLAVGILTVVHESGHFLLARAFGVKVLRFSVGLGKPIFSWQSKSGTLYAISPIPFGGYLQLLGQDNNDVAASDAHLAFCHKPFWQRVLILLAGPLANLLFALLAYWAVLTIGLVGPLPILGDVPKGSVAEIAGFKAGQQILAVNDQPTPSWDEVSVEMLIALGDTAYIQVKTIDSAHKLLEKHFVPLRKFDLSKSDGNVIKDLGLIPVKQRPLPPSMLETQKYPTHVAFYKAQERTGSYTFVMVQFIRKLITGKLPLKMLAGPLAIAKFAGLSIAAGVAQYLNFLAFVSINLAVINLLPIPILDGGNILFCVIELIISRSLTVMEIVWARFAGVAILGAVFALAIYNDLIRILLTT